MAYLSWLEAALAGKLGERPIGSPVALRAYLQLTSDHGLLSSYAAAVTAFAEHWLGSAAISVYSQGRVEAGYISVLAQFAGGETALVVSELVRPGDGVLRERPAVKLLLIGNHGTLEFEDAPGADGLRVDLSTPADARTRALSRAVEQSLANGNPSVTAAG